MNTIFPKMPSYGSGADQETTFVGAFARDQGALVPDRLVSSAKSWLCHSNVDRRARILPWGAADEIPKISPVTATAAYLKHIRLAWNRAWGQDEESASGKPARRRHRAGLF